MNAGLPGRILVIGLMASGKTTIGRALSARLQRPYLDNDALLERRTGHTLAEFSTMDVAVLHAAELATFAALLDTPGPWVASAAASVVLDSGSITSLRSSGVRTVWLRARPETLAARAGSGAGRPLLRPDPLTAFMVMMHEREAAFQEVADLTVDVDSGSVAAIVDHILSGLRPA